MPKYLSQGEIDAILQYVKLEQASLSDAGVEDTFTLTVDVRGSLLDNGTLSYEFAGTFNRMKTSDETMNTDSINSNFRIAYQLAESLWGIMNPSVGFRGLYNRTKDKIFDEAIKSEQIEKKKDLLQELDQKQERLKDSLKETDSDSTKKRIKESIQKIDDLKERIQENIEKEQRNQKG